MVGDVRRSSGDESRCLGTHIVAGVVEVDAVLARGRLLDPLETQGEPGLLVADADHDEVADVGVDDPARLLSPPGGQTLRIRGVDRDLTKRKAHTADTIGSCENGAMPPSTDRLILAEMTLNDLPALQAMMQDPEVMTAYEGPYSDSEVLAWLTRQIDRYHDDGFGLWKVILRESGALIGQCGITWQDIDGHRVLEIGYLFNRAHWHQGYATEAARACRTWAFTELGASEVFSQIRDTNIASMNVAIRMGMTIRSRFVKHFRGIDMPHFAFAIDRATWEMLTDPLFIVRLREKDDSGTTNVDDIDWDAL